MGNDMQQRWAVTKIQHNARQAAAYVCLHFAVLVVLLIQLSAHATQLHRPITMAADVTHTHEAHAHSSQASHDDSGLPPHVHLAPCVFASAPMLMCVLPVFMAGLAPFGHINLQLPPRWPSVFRVPLPPPK